VSDALDSSVDYTGWIRFKEGTTILVMSRAGLQGEKEKLLSVLPPVIKLVVGRLLSLIIHSPITFRTMNGFGGRPWSGTVRPKHQTEAERHRTDRMGRIR